MATTCRDGDSSWRGRVRYIVLMVDLGGLDMLSVKMILIGSNSTMIEMDGVTHGMWRQT